MSKKKSYLFRRVRTHLSIYPQSFKLPLGGQGDRPMSVDILRDSANTRSQQRGGLKGEGYTNFYHRRQ
ncbi:hypothetical protein [Candidatus Regiella insecticola]|uniref:hypothetical protein n=1 Tax=Candidatus Regiella insecticola TaxID=138073 RepID=UPI001C3F9A2B|nr:hypothetical protein [Candidatus Regiella insecticola]